MLLPLLLASRGARPASRPLSSFEHLEATASNCHPLLKGNVAAAFVVRRGRREEVVVIAEVSRRLHRLWQLDLTGEGNPLVEEIKAAIRRAMWERHRTEVDAVALVPRGAIPRASNGSILRTRCRKAYVEGCLTRVD